MIGGWQSVGSSDHLGRAHAVELRHAHVHQHHVIGGAADRLDGFPAITDDVDPVAELSEHQLRDPLIYRVVLSDQDVQRVLGVGRRVAGTPTADRLDREQRRLARGNRAQQLLLQHIALGRFGQGRDEQRAVR
jgi:hypothetical protein